MTSPSLILRRSRATELFSLTGAVSLAVGWSWSISLVNIGLVLLAVALAFDWSNSWQRLRGNPVFWLSLIASGYLITSTILAVDAYPQSSIDISKTLTRYLALVGLPGILLACALNGDTRRIAWIYAIALVALLLVILSHCTPEQIQSYLAGQRADFGLSINGFPVYALTGVLALLAFGPMTVAKVADKRRPATILIVSCAIAVLALAAIFSQTRSAFLSASLILPATFALLLWLHLQNTATLAQQGRRFQFAALIAFAVVLIGVWSFGADHIGDRFSRDTNTPAIASQLKLDDIPIGEITDRVSLWELAINRITERPWFGWGAGSAPTLIAQLPGAPSFPHFHNLYIHLLVEVGIVGTLLVLGVFLSWAAAVRNALRRRNIPPELALFLASAGTFYLLVNLAQIRFDDWHGGAYLTLLVGLALTWSSKESRNE